MEVSGQHHALSNLPPEKRPQCPLNRVGGPKANLDMVAKRKHPYPTVSFNVKVMKKLCWEYNKHF